MSKKKKYPWPHFIDEETKTIYTYVASGWPTVMMVPKKVEEYFPGYNSSLISQCQYEKMKETL